MAEHTPREAVDAFLYRIRATLACVIEGTAFGTGTAEGREHSVSLLVPGQRVLNVARLSTHGGTGELGFQLSYLYTVERMPRPGERDTFGVDTAFYQYKILDYAGNEIVVYDWAPFGAGPVRTPHLHIPAAGSIVMKQRPGSPLEDRKTYLGNLHLPTGRIVLEDIVELLIREFQVVPRRDDWHEVLAANREAGGDTSLR